MISLKDLKAARTAMTPGVWRMHTPGCNPNGPICGWTTNHDAEGPFGGKAATGPDVWTKEEEALADALGIVATHNAADVLIEIAEAALAWARPVICEQSARDLYTAQQALFAALRKVSP